MKKKQRIKKYIYLLIKSGSMVCGEYSKKNKGKIVSTSNDLFCKTKVFLFDEIVRSWEDILLPTINVG